MDVILPDLSRVKTVLDIGCGKGFRDLKVFKSLGIPQCIGIDFFEFHENIPDGIQYIQADVDGYDIDIEPESVDLIILDNVIEHLYHPKKVLQECYKILKKDGVLFILTPNQASIKNRVNLLLGRSVYYPLEYWMNPGPENIGDGPGITFHGHIREYCLYELVKLIESADFTILSTNMMHSLTPSKTEKIATHKSLFRLYQLIEQIYPAGAWMMSVVSSKKGRPEKQAAYDDS